MAFATWRLWLPVVVLLTGGAISGALWNSAREEAANNVQALLSSEAKHYSDLTVSRVEAVEYSLIRMSRRWAFLEGIPPDVWTADATSFIGDIPAIRKMQRLDSDFVLRWEVAPGTSRTDLNQDVSPAAAERERLAAARTARDAVVSDLHEDASGGRSVVIYVPLFVGARFDGYVAAELDLRQFFSDLYERTDLKDAVSIRRAGVPIVTFGTPAQGAAAGLTGTAAAPVNGLSFDIVVEPGPDSPTASGMNTARYILLAGLFVTALASALAWQRVQISARSGQLRSAHDRLSEHERRYREILRRGGVGFAVADPFGRILEANEPFATMLGFKTPEHATGHALSEFVPTANGERTKNFLEKLKATTDALHEEISLRQVTGGTVAAAASCVVDKAPDGSSRVLLLAEDITERTTAHQQVAEARRVYEEIFNTADVAITDVDLSQVFVRLQELRAQGVKDLRGYLEDKTEHLEEFCRLTKLNTINRAGLRLFGASSVDVVLAQDNYFLQGARVHVVRDIVAAMWEGQESLRKEMPHSTFTGRDIVVISSLRLPATLAEAKRVPIVTVDITDVRSAENARRANIAKTQFLASMSHEIRTPLNGVIGNLELLAQADLTPDQEDLLFDAEKAAKSLLALIGNILDFSKIEAGKLSIETVELNPGIIVQEAVDIVQSRARQKGIYVTASIGPDVPQIVKGDPSRIRQILLNLLGNSVKFTDVGGVHIGLRVRDWDDRICQLLFQVHDSGRGFNQSAAQSLFQPFTQDQRPAGGEEFEGTGLGLSICKSLVDSFGGEIECESVPDRGASFWFTIPVQVVKPASPTPKPDLLGRTVLFGNVAPDAIPGPLSAYFAARGAKILSADNDAAALSLARAAIMRGSQIDLVIYSAMGTTWPAPGVAGALRDHQAMPVIYAPESTPAMWRQALRSGASYLLPKGITEEFLDRNLDQVFHGLSRLGERTLAPATSEVDAGALFGKHVLVLEDRLVNQTIIQRQLKKLGISCTLASDGMIGLDKVATGTYDLILCDCSMPEMNGYEFTRILRQREEEQGKQHVPVIAMTANAFREDMEKCYAAGMDDFVSKPVTLQRLAAVLSQWLAPKDEPIVVLDAPRNRAGLEALDIAVLQQLLGSDDHHIIVDVVQEFVLSARESWAEVQGQVARRDAHGLTNAAHGAKGEARNAGAVALGDLYEELERIAKNDNFEAVETVLTAIPAELNRVQDFVDRFVAGVAK